MICSENVPKLRKKLDREKQKKSLRMNCLIKGKNGIKKEIQLLKKEQNKIHLIIYIFQHTRRQIGMGYAGRKEINGQKQAKSFQYYSETILITI